MIIDVGEGETVTVILASGARLVGPLHWAGETLAEIDGWIIDTTKVQGYRLGEHPWRKPGPKPKVEITIDPRKPSPPRGM